jgi:ankyrin repeat protein
MDLAKTIRHACITGDLHLIQHLSTFPKFWNICGYRHLKLTLDHLPLAQWILDNHPGAPFSHCFPLHDACKHSLPCVQLLHSYISLESRDDEQRTPFLIACSQGNLPLCQYLYSQGANPHSKNISHESAAHFACESGNLSLLIWLHSITPINEVDVYGNSIMSLAALHGHAHLIPWLRQHLSVEHKTNTGKTPFMIACSKGHLSTAQLLPYTSNTDNFNHSALYYAIYFNHTHVVEWLCSFGVPYDESILYGPFRVTLILHGACNYNTPFITHLKKLKTIRHQLNVHYQQRCIILNRRIRQFDDLTEHMPWCSDVSFHIGEYVGILRNHLWENLLRF